MYGQKYMGGKILIIGANIPGLSAGCYAQMNGFDSEIFETSYNPGGNCTGLIKKDYYIDTCMHWISGIRRDSGFFNRMWRELGALDDVPVVTQEIFTDVTTPSYPHFLIYSNAEKWGEYLLSVAPEDAAQIRELVDDIKSLSDIQVPEKAVELMGLRDQAALGREFNAYKKIFAKYVRKSVKDVAAGFANAAVREGLVHGFSGERLPALSMILLLGQFHGKNAGWIKGGSLQFAKRIADRYTGLNGKLRCGMRVKEIVIEKNTAVGVKLDNENFYPADIIISAIDGKSTILDLIGKKHASRELKLISELQSSDMYTPTIQVAFGVNKDFTGEPHFTRYRLSTPVTFGEAAVKSLAVKHFCFDESAAPAGKSVVSVIFDITNDYFSGLYRNREQYNRQKDRIIEDVLAYMNVLKPGFSRSVEVTDLSTSWNILHQTGNWRAGYEGLFPLSRNGMFKSLSKTIPRLKNFFMIGQWLSPGGGLPALARHGRDVMQIICASEKTAFTSRLPEEDTET